MTDLLMQSGSKGSSNERTCQTLKVGKFYLDSINHLVDMARDCAPCYFIRTIIFAQSIFQSDGSGNFITCIGGSWYEI